ncbi:MAG: hypothetical protein F6K22_37885, partial [Okeania sp. SIO2F4]|uniref:hypothetical protein n=1 Tax=Okeania sp. SIO2F4 TaxID=2607790 RepID=UPI00142B6C05
TFVSVFEEVSIRFRRLNPDFTVWLNFFFSPDLVFDFNHQKIIGKFRGNISTFVSVFEEVSIRFRRLNPDFTVWLNFFFSPDLVFDFNHQKII